MYEWLLSQGINSAYEDVCLYYIFIISRRSFTPPKQFVGKTFVVLPSNDQIFDWEAYPNAWVE